MREKKGTQRKFGPVLKFLIAQENNLLLYLLRELEKLGFLLGKCHPGKLPFSGFRELPSPLTISVDTCISSITSVYAYESAYYRILFFSSML